MNDRTLVKATASENCIVFRTVSRSRKSPKRFYVTRDEFARLECQIKNHIKPNLGAVKLESLNTHTIQKFYNRLGEERDGRPALSPKSIKIVHGVLHKALGQAVALNYLRLNPADACILPRVIRKELEPLDEDATARFVEAIKGHTYENVFLVTLFTGMRQGEVLGLSWDCVDFTKGTILINKQLQKSTGGGSVYNLLTTKNGKGRVVTPAPFVMELLQTQRTRQAKWRQKAGPLWEDSGLVFTNELGGHLMPHTIYHNYKKVVASIGLPNARFHDGCIKIGLNQKQPHGKGGTDLVLFLFYKHRRRLK